MDPIVFVWLGGKLRPFLSDGRLFDERQDKGGHLNPIL